MILKKIRNWVDNGSTCDRILNDVNKLLANSLFGKDLRLLNKALRERNVSLQKLVESQDVVIVVQRELIENDDILHMTLKNQIDNLKNQIKQLESIE